MISEIILCEGGGNYPAVAVPLVALGTQSGAVDVVDVSANAVAASFSVHPGTVRGLRWLGNSRLVSFSYSQVHDIWISNFYHFTYYLSFERERERDRMAFLLPLPFIIGMPVIR